MRKGEPPFLRLGRDPEVDQESALTIVKMIDAVAFDLPSGSWNREKLPSLLEEANRKDFRELIDVANLQTVWELLSQKEWFSLQNTDDEVRRISTLAPMEGMTRLRSLFLGGNRIQDIQPLSGLKDLKDLSIGNNRIRDLDPIQTLRSIERLDLYQNPIRSFRALEELPRLRALTISPEQARFTDCRRLSELRRLRIEGDEEIKDFEGFPETPSLRVLKVHSKGLSGIERFQSLENLVVFEGQFSSLEGFLGLQSLTHLSISTSRPLDLQPVAGLHKLRRLYVKAPRIENLRTLIGLPALHEVEVHPHTDHNTSDLKALRRTLTPWSSDFIDVTRAVSPSPTIEVVDQQTFDDYDTRRRFGITEEESNEEMLDEERSWLIDEIRNCLENRFDYESEFVMAHRGGFRRSDTLVVYSCAAYDAVGEIASDVQRILCRCRNNWILYFQSLLDEGPDASIDEREDFIVWLYPDKILATKENAKIIGGLLSKPRRKAGLQRTLRRVSRKVLKLVRRK